MDTQFGIVVPLWSYTADGGALLERAAGEVGLDHVTVPVVTGALSAFRLAADPERPYFRTEGGWHFPPTAKLYGASGVRPPKAAWFGTADALARLREHLDRLHIALVVRIELRAVRILGEREPHLGQRNAWGQEVPPAGLCACNPSVRELLRATLEDLGRYEAKSVELANWRPDHVVWSTPPRPAHWRDPAIRQLLDTCFCPACRQTAERAGVEPDQAARRVRVCVQRLIDAPPGVEPSTEADEVVAAYCAARVADCGLWLQRLAQADAHRDCRLLDGPEPPTSYGDLRPVAQLYRLPADSPLDKEHFERLLQLQARDRFAGWSLPAWRPCFNAAASLVFAVSAATAAGVRIYDFEGLDEAAPDAVTWLKQAVRFARRA
jgi:hypothetical protein